MHNQALEWTGVLILLWLVEWKEVQVIDTMRICVSSLGLKIFPFDWIVWLWGKRPTASCIDVLMASTQYQYFKYFHSAETKRRGGKCATLTGDV